MSGVDPRKGKQTAKPPPPVKPAAVAGRRTSGTAGQSSHSGGQSSRTGGESSRSGGQSALTGGEPARSTSSKRRRGSKQTESSHGAVPDPNIDPDLPPSDLFHRPGEPAVSFHSIQFNARS
jgi:hypothetical protein